MIDNTNDIAREELRINLEDCLLVFIQDQKGAAQASADVVSIMRKAIYKTPSLAFYADPKENTLRGMIKPHDTSTPSMSTESVKSEEFVLVPREPTDDMLQAGFELVNQYADIYGRTRLAEECYRAMIAAAPTLSEATAAPAPQPGEAVREALETARDYISDAAAGALTYKDSEEGFKAMAADDLVRLDAALSALSVPSPAGEAGEPASQTEGMGGDAVRSFFSGAFFTSEVGGGESAVLKIRFPSVQAMQDARSALLAALTPPETAGAVKALETAREDTAHLNWLEANPNADIIQEGGFEGDPEWVVYLINGGRNDREWHELARGVTVREAIAAARSASSQGGE